MSICVIACIFGKEFGNVYPSVKNYDAFLFSNNIKIKDTVEKFGWKYIFLDLPLSDDDAISSFQSKYIKFLQFLKNEEFNYFHKYEKIIYTDHKNELKDEHIENLLNKMDNRNIIIRIHPEEKKNIWEEAGEAILQERYLIFMPMTVNYIREKIIEGYLENCVIALTSIIGYKHLEKETIEFADKIYNDIKMIGTSQCWIIWSIIGQKYNDVIRTIKWNELRIKNEEPKNVKIANIYFSEINKETQKKVIDIERDLVKIFCKNKKFNNKNGYVIKLKDNVCFLKEKLDNRINQVEEFLEKERCLQREIQNKSEYIDHLKNKIANYKDEIRNMDGHINQLILSEKEINKEIFDITNSGTWRIYHKISLYIQNVFPIYSKRRLFLKLIFTFVKYPVKFLLKMTPKRIYGFFKVLKKEGTIGVLRLINEHFIYSKSPQYSQKLDIFEINNTYKKITEFKPLIFNFEDKPLVSIIIPVYNQFNFTYNCLKSILNYSGKKVRYEIIIADDCSNDFTKEINKIIFNIRVVKTPENYGFLKNCNNAAKQAKGEYILFLNNDTQVQENWLFPLVELIEREDNIGAVGSKLVFKNGMLQEAGAIFWNDASAWNYGRMSDPALPEFNYVKEVDYISGSALMIRRSIWNNLGGFDEIFTPAYCEDADICFSIRKKGYKVMYQPESVVVHFEGISNGTDTSEGLKKFQVINKEKIFAKWKDILVSEHFPNGDSVFHARDRSANKKTLLMIDHYVPQFDKDAGSVTDFQYIKLFLSLGYNVKFIGDNFYKHEPYTYILEQMGVEILYGKYYAKNWKTWLKANGKYIDYVYLNRLHISVKYIDEIKMYTKAKIFYYGHDLRFLREIREYEIKNDSRFLQSSIKCKKMEIELLYKTDVCYYPSTIEVDEIKKIDKSINVKLIPPFLYENKHITKRDFSNTKDLMFIGGFDHKPNIDGVLWYVNEIYPILKKRCPEIRTYILGSNTPEEILALNTEYILVMGYVTETQLCEYYKNCRLSIVPLRYGAGIKGKVIEAMYNQLPVITTSIGSEGIQFAENCLIIKDDPISFAEEIIRVYNDLDLLSEISLKEIEIINERFTISSAKKIIMEDLTS